MAEYVRDTFARTVGAGLGSADVGGVWTAAGAGMSVDPAAGGRAILAMSGTADATAHQRLAAATPALDIIAAVAYRLPALEAVHTIRVLGRVDVASSIASPTGDYGQVDIWPDGSMAVSVGVAVAGVYQAADPAQLPAGTYVPGRTWRLELEVIGTEDADTSTEVRVRTWDMDDPDPEPEFDLPPDQADGWLLAEAAVVASSSITYDGGTGAVATDITPVGPQVAGVYQLTLSRDLATAGTSWEVADVYVTDPVRPTFAWELVDPAAGTVRFTPADTGDPVAWSWDYADGGGDTSSGIVEHTYAEPGYYTVTYTLTTRWGSPWYYTDGVVAAYDPEPMARSSGSITPALRLPVVTIDGVGSCDVYRATWTRGSTFWTDGLVGGSGTFDLRGRIPVQKGARINVALPNGAGGRPLWRGYVDTVHYRLEPVEPKTTTQLVAYDVAAHLGRRHVHKGHNLREHTLPSRLDQLIPHPGIHFHARYPVVESGRYPRLLKRAYKRDHLRRSTYLDLIRAACQASIAFAYCREDGTIVYGPWDAPDDLELAIRVDLDGDLDCPSSIETDRRAEGLIVNRWTVADGDHVDRTSRGSVDKYGEHQYQVDDLVLKHDGDLPLSNGMFKRMRHPHSAPAVVIPIRDHAQHALLADPMDIARWEGRLYAILGVTHTVEVQTWTVALALDRNPWAIHGVDEPEQPPDPPGPLPAIGVDEFGRADPAGYGWGTADNGSSWITDLGPGDMYGDLYPMAVAAGVGRATSITVGDDAQPMLAPTHLAYVPARPFDMLWRWRVVMPTAVPAGEGFLLSLFGTPGAAVLDLWVSPTAPSGSPAAGPGIVWDADSGASFEAWRYSLIHIDDAGWSTRTWRDGDAQPSTWDATGDWSVLSQPTLTRIGLLGLDIYTGASWGPELVVDYVRRS